MKTNKTNIYISILLLAGIFTSCGLFSPRYTELYTPEESGLNLLRISDENTSVVAGGFNDWYGSYTFFRALSISPEGKELAYLSNINNQNVVCIRNVGQGNQATQRSFRPSYSLYWGSDNKIYFGDDSYTATRPICCVDAHTGSIMKQYTNSNVDLNPVLTKDGKKLFFSRILNGQSSIWCYDMKTSALMLCCNGSCPFPVDKQGSTILCCRQLNNKWSIWSVNYEKGEETMILADPGKDFTCPVLSPNGKWIVCQGTAYSSQTKKTNLDIYCVKMDGTNLVQLTTHPEQDLSPVWSVDGKYIYFISSRGNKNKKYGIWRMNFNAE